MQRLMVVLLMIHTHVYTFKGAIGRPRLLRSPPLLPFAMAPRKKRTLTVFLNGSNAGPSASSPSPTPSDPGEAIPVKIVFHNRSTVPPVVPTTQETGPVLPDEEETLDEYYQELEWRESRKAPVGPPPIFAVPDGPREEPDNFGPDPIELVEQMEHVTLEVRAHLACSQW